MHHRFVHPVLILILSALTAFPATAGEVGKHPDAPAELAALEFLVGEWDLTTSFAQADGSRREAKAKLVGRWAMNGMAIVVEETHPYPEGAGGIFAGMVIYTVRPKDRRIVGASNNTLGNRKHYEATVKADEVHLVQTGELFKGREGFNRHTFHSIGPGSFSLRLDACPAKGEDCKEGSYSYAAKRRTP